MTARSTATPPASPKLLRTPGLARLTGTLLLSSTADMFALMALLWFVLKTTGSSTSMGILVLCTGLPAIIGAPLGGRLLDRFDPGRLMAADNIARAGLLAAIPLVHTAGALSIGLLYAFAAAIGLLSPVTFAGCRVVLPRLVPAGRLPSANALLSVGEQFPLLIGPAAAGPVVAAVGGTTALYAPAVALAVAGLLVLRLPAQAKARVAPDESAKAPTVTGFGFGPLLRRPALRALLLLSIIYYFAYGPLEPALPLYVERTLHADAGAYGLIWTVFGIGALAGLVTVRPLSRLRPGVVNALSVIVWGCVLLPFALGAPLPLACALMFVGAFAWAPYAPLEISTIQRLIPPHQHGTVLGARRAALVLASPLGAAAGGVLLEHVPPGATIAVSGAACLTVGVACLLGPSLRAVRPANPETEEPGRSDEPGHSAAQNPAHTASGVVRPE